MGYTPKSKHLKPDAVPTIFADSKPNKRRELSEKRIEKKNRDETISELLTETSGHESIEGGLTSEVPSEIPSHSTDEEIISRKRKAANKRSKGKKQKRTEEDPLFKSKDIGIQVSTDTYDVGISCNIPTDHSNMISCSNCYAREHPSIVMTDHLYSNKTCNKVDPGTSRKSTSNLQKFENDATDSEPMCSSDNDLDQINFKTPTKEHKADPTYEPSPMSDYSPEVAQPPRQEDRQPVQDTKYIVFASCLKKLFAFVHCSTCDSPVDADDIQSHTEGTCLTVTFTCMQGHEFKWKSQPVLKQQPAGNVLVTAAICFSGNTLAKMESFCDTFKLAFISRKTFHKIESDYVIPSIHRLWLDQKDIIMGSLRSYKLTVSGDGRCDSPGYNAKYCTYTIMEAKTSAIIGFNVVQVTEAENSSSKMELIGFKRSMEDLKREGIEIKTIATDRHVQIRKYMKEAYPHINHQFDGI